jgi:carbon-monoxide dehydrogenase medium subunit
MSELQVARPGDLDSLKVLLARCGAAAQFIAGGTDMLVAPREAPEAGWLIDISRTAGLSGIRHAGEALHIGATTTLSDLIASPEIATHAPVLAEAADLCGSVQIRNRATIGGNVANASPAGDLLPVLKCLDAGFSILGPDGTMTHRGFDETVGRLPRAALITAVVIPLEGSLPRAGFVKLGVRDDLTIARRNLARAAAIDPAGRFTAARLVAGAIAPLPLRLTAAEAVLEGADFTPQRVELFLEALLAAVDVAIPGRASQPYKRRAIMGLGLDLLAKVTGRRELAS